MNGTKAARVTYSSRIRSFLMIRRDVAFVLPVTFAIVLLVLSMYLTLTSGGVDRREVALFEAVNRLLGSLKGLMLVSTVFGSWYSLPFMALLGYAFGRSKHMLIMVLAAISASTAAHYAKMAVGRGRPVDLLDSVRLMSSEQLGNNGFPSAHAAYSMAVATLLWYVAPKRFRPLWVLLVLLVGLSRLYLGVHFPLDILGGWGFGMLLGASFGLLFGAQVWSPTAKASDTKKITSAREFEMEQLTLRRSGLLLLVALLLYVLLPQWSELGNVMTILGELRWQWFGVALLGVLVSFLSAGWVIVLLSPVKISLTHSVFAQLASSVASKVLPGGFATAAVTTRFMRKQKISATDIAIVLVLERTVGFVMFMMPLVILATFSGTQIERSLRIEHPLIKYLPVVSVALIAFGVVCYPRVRRWVIELLLKLIASFARLLKTPYRLLFSLLASLGVSTGYVLSLYGALLAIGYSPSLAMVVLVYAGASIVKSASPTPGGLGVLEVGIAAALVAAGVPVAEAYAAVVVYRLVTYWLPTPVGLIAYRWLNARQLL